MSMIFSPMSVSFQWYYNPLLYRCCATICTGSVSPWSPGPQGGTSGRQWSLTGGPWVNWCTAHTGTGTRHTISPAPSSGWDPLTPAGAVKSSPELGWCRYHDFVPTKLSQIKLFTYKVGHVRYFISDGTLMNTNELPSSFSGTRFTHLPVLPFLPLHCHQIKILRKSLHIISGYYDKLYQTPPITWHKREMWKMQQKPNMMLHSIILK